MVEIDFITALKGKKDGGFTLMELVIVIGLISLLVALGTLIYRDMASRTADAHAFIEGQNLFSAASEAFLADEDVLFTVVGDLTGPVGDVRFSDGNPRTPVFNLSPKIRARVTGQSTVGVGGGFLTYDIWSVEGTREFTFQIDEDANIVSTPPY